jgi:transketolase
MRNAFINTLTKLAQRDKRIYLLTGDLGYSVFENFAKEFKDRFLNCGVAEQNMMGVAAGLALEGKKPYVYSIIPFITFRCLEQIRNDIAYQNLDVKLVGVGGGLSYGELGATHHAIEDLGILRLLANFQVFCPGDPLEAEQLLLKSYKTPGPAYIRLNRSGDKIIHQKKDKIEIGKPFVLENGKDGAIVANGIFLGIGKEIRENLKAEGYDFKLISLPTLKPVDKAALYRVLKDQKLVFSMEEHKILGGLGTVLSEILIERDWKGKLEKVAVPDEFFQGTGKAEYIRKKYKMTSEQITKYILKKIKKR